jgi:hypothetical protein
MKTKAHGWISHEWRGLLDGDGFVELLRTSSKYPIEEPVCLLPPSTCDKVRAALEDALRDPEIAESELGSEFAELLKLLPEVSDE